MGLLQQTWNKYKYGNYLTKIIYINVAVYVFINISRVFIFLLHVDNEGLYYPLNYLMLPADTGKLLHSPWTILTYMFTHEEILHIVFNMLWLYWFGKIFIDYLSSKKLLYTYLIGGFFGALFYVCAFNLFPVFADIVSTSKALGASAAVIAIVVTIAFYIPEYKMNILFIGQVKIKYIAFFTIIVDFLSIAGENSGGHIAHLGGAFYGLMYGLTLRSDKIKVKFPTFNFFRKRKPKKRPQKMSDSEYNYEKAQQQKEIDRILDKIAHSGYDSLSKKEKESLFTTGKK
jgi:membrane associated rhomboid family serine protease